MLEQGSFDSSIQMYVEAPKTASIKHLQFIRFRADRGDFGHLPLSTPRGGDLFRLSISEISAYAMRQANEVRQPRSDYEQTNL